MSSRRNSETDKDTRDGQKYNDEISDGVNKINLRERPRRKLRKEAADNLDFLSDFNPEKSLRERRKLNRKVGVMSKDAPYDSNGKLKEHKFIDCCDCLNDLCDGCFYPCPSCGSTKCGPTCRCNRKYAFEGMEFDGKDLKITNKFFPNIKNSKIIKKKEKK